MSNRDGSGEGCLVALIAIAALGLWLGWWGKKEKWTAFVYPNREHLENSVQLGPFDRFEDCQQSAINALRATPAMTEHGDYLCGTDCEFRPEIGVSVCKDTKK